MLRLNKLIFFLGMLLSIPCTFANESPANLYQYQAENIYQSMSLDERVGQMLLPTYRLLATAVPQPAGKNPGDLCKEKLNSINPAIDDVIKACGLDQIEKSHVGAVLADGGPYYNAPTLRNWNNLNALAIKVHKKAIHDPLLFIGNDAIHGNSHVQGGVIFPHDINLGVTHDENLIKHIGQLTAEDSLRSGFNWAYMPTVAIAQDLRWGRTYESFGQDPQLAKLLAHAYINGFQQIENDKLTGVLASVKHFVGDGATQYGLDEGNAVFSQNFNDFWKMNGLGYEGALQAGVLNIMVSYSAMNGERMHLGGQWDIVNTFKNKGIQGSDGQLYAFKGFTVSDYNGPTRASYFYNLTHTDHPLKTLPDMFAKSVNAGVDMIMLGNGDTKNPFDPNAPFNYKSVAEAAEALKSAVKQGIISETRLKDAVTRILAVKLAMNSHLKTSSYQALQKPERAIALQAAQQSLVLLKNDKNLLPLKPEKIKALKNIIFLGESNDIGVQNGGWTINWQGQKGNQYFTGADQQSSGATSIEQSLPQLLSQQFKQPVNILHGKDVQAANPHFSASDTIAVTVIAEPPYAEYMGDIGNHQQPDAWYDRGALGGENTYMPKKQSQQLKLEWITQDAAAVQALHAKGIPVITIVYSGRPVILTAGTAPLTHSDAVIAAFLPGTLGGNALANALLGKYHFRQNGKSNVLTFPWPRDMNDVSHHFKDGALFKIGYGLST